MKIFVHKCVEIFLHRCLKMARYKMYVCNYNPKDNTRIVKIFCEFISVEQTMFLIISCYKDLPSPPQIAVFKKVPTSQTLDLFFADIVNVCRPARTTATAIERAPCGSAKYNFCIPNFWFSFYGVFKEGLVCMMTLH